MSATEETSVRQVDMHLEVDIIPVSDVDRAKEFYQRLGWRLDRHTYTQAGSYTATLTVSDIEAAHDELTGRGIDTSEIWHGPPFPVEARQPGTDPERTSYGSFCSFSDPDGNTWLVQEVTTRLPGRIAADPAYASAAALVGALQRAEAAHVERQKRTGRSHLFHRSAQDENWPAWYAAYMTAEQAGTDLPS